MFLLKTCPQDKIILLWLVCLRVGGGVILVFFLFDHNDSFSNIYSSLWNVFGEINDTLLYYFIQFDIWHFSCHWSGIYPMFLTPLMLLFWHNNIHWATYIHRSYQPVPVSLLRRVHFPYPTISGWVINSIDNRCLQTGQWKPLSCLPWGREPVSLAELRHPCLPRHHPVADC